MTECLRPLLYKHCLVWIDDILVWANSLADYVDVLRQLFAICEKHRLRLNPAKSTLLCHEIKWCGRIIDGNGVRQDPERMEALCNIPYPTDAGQLQQFICAVNWVRDSLIGFAQAVHPLQKRLTQALEGKKRKKRIASSITINLTDEEKSSWNDVKDLLRSSVQLCHPDESATMCLFTDASKDGWSIVVTQVREFDEKIPVHEQQHEMLVCQSGMFDKTQMNWSVIEKEGYPIARACDSLKYLLLRPLGFRMYCDHKNLIHVFAPNAELKTHTRDKLLRWADNISQYRYEIEHIDGVHNIWADLMSRWGQPAPVKSHVNRLRVDEPPCFAETSISRRTSRRYARALKQWTKRRKRQSHNFVYKPPQAKIRPLDDPEFIWPDIDSIIDAQQRHTAPRTAILHEDGMLYLRDRIWIPDEAYDLLTRLLIIAHRGSMGHRGHHAMAHNLRRIFYTDDLDGKIATFLKSCLLCPHIRGGKIVQRPQGNTWTATRRNEGLHFDFLFMGETWKGSKYVLVLKDDLTHFVKLVACDSPTSQVTVDAIMEWSALFFVPQVWISDGGTHFKNTVMKELASRLKAQHNIVLAYCPWRNGSVERVNRDILSVMRAMLAESRLNETEWDYLLPVVKANLNQTPTESLGGISPMFAYTGLEPTTPLNVVVGRVNRKLHTDRLHELNMEKTSIKNAMRNLNQSLQELHKKILDRKRAAQNRNMLLKTNTSELNVSEGDYVLWS
ncbi:hypothetical protein LEN26_013685 [Aphanomyces euteiches]|nr:hypothetical protein LEN26_013685 [Aphanomyces euteiches]